MAPRGRALASVPHATLLARGDLLLRGWRGNSSPPNGRLWRLLAATESTPPAWPAGPVARGAAAARLTSTDSREHIPGRDAAGAGSSETRSPSAITSGVQPPPKRTPKALGRRRDAGAASAGGGGGSGDASPAAGPSPGLLSVLGAMAGLFRAGLGAAGGAGMGVGRAAFGLQALARLHEEQRLSDHPPGRVLPRGAAVQREAERLMDALELAHGAYRRSAAALAATTCLRVQHVRSWRPEGGSLQPGYFVAVDHFGRRVVWGVRGTRVFSDVLTDLAMAAHPLGCGAAHWGMTHAAHWVLQREATRVAALLRSLSSPGCPPFRLQLVGHSLGGSVAALAAVMLRERLVEVARTAAIPPELISCVAFAPAATMSPPLAELCRPYVTSVVLNNDIVPRFNSASLARLQEELRGVDWYSELQRTVLGHTLVKGLSTTLEALTPAPGATGPEALQPPPVTLLAAPAVGHAGPATAAAAQPPQASDGGGAAAATAAVVQQLSAAVLESAAFKSAVQSLDEWKAKVVAAAGDQAEAAMRRQLELVQAWLHEVAAGRRPPAAHAGKDSLPGGAASEPPQSREKKDDDAGGGSTAAAGAAGPTGAAADAAADIRRAAEAAAERLRENVESAMASLTAAAAASRDRLSASLPQLPSLPSLPQAHELPLVEATDAGAAAAAAAAASASALSSELRAADGGARGGDGAAVFASTWDSANAAELVGEGMTAAAAGPAGAAAGAAAGAGTRATRMTAGATPGAPQADQLIHQELPLLLPPGRILYIRLHTDEPPSPSSSSADAVCRPGGSGGDSGVGRGGGGRPSRSGYVVSELPTGHGFRRLILGRSSLEEHQCRAYRRVLMQLAFREEPEA